MFWSVVATHPQNESRATSHLQRQGFTCYAPREKFVMVRRGRKVDVVRYMFPRYVFVWVENQWHAISGTFGVSRVLTNECGMPSRLPEGWVETMMQQETEGFIQLPKNERRVGDTVTIASGVLAGWVGLYQGQTSKQREVVLLERLGRVELAVGCLL